MNDATDDGGTRKASTVETAATGTDGDAGAAAGGQTARPAGPQAARQRSRDRGRHAGQA